MDSEQRDRLVGLFEAVNSIVKSIPRRKRMSVDEFEIVFVDSVNGRNKHRRAYTFIEIMEAIEDGSKPVGVILLYWMNPDAMEMKEFSNISHDEQATLAAAFAEAQDQQQQESEEDGD